MNEPYFLDTDVVIDFLRGRPETIVLFESLSERPMISMLSVAELFAGVREGAERTSLELLLNGIEKIEVTEPIAVRGGLLRRQFGKSHNVGLADAVIAASVESTSTTLLTLNRKHFPMLVNVHVPYQKP